MKRFRIFLLLSALTGIKSALGMESPAKQSLLDFLPQELKSLLRHYLMEQTPEEVIENWTYPRKPGYAEINTDLIKKLLMDPRIKQYFAGFTNAQTGMTGLMKAAEIGDPDLIKIFLEAGSTINQQDRGGWTALMYAAAHKNQHLIDLLLKSGADRTLKNKEGKTAVDIFRSQASSSPSAVPHRWFRNF